MIPPVCWLTPFTRVTAEHDIPVTPMRKRYAQIRARVAQNAGHTPLSQFSHFCRDALSASPNRVFAAFLLSSIYARDRMLLMFFFFFFDPAAEARACHGLSFCRCHII